MAWQKLTKVEISYTWRQLAQRAGLTDGDPNGTGFESLNIPIFYGLPDQFNVNKPGIIVVPTRPEAWHELLSRPPRSLIWLPADKVMPTKQPLPVETTVPVLFWGQGYQDGSKLFAEQLEDGSIVFYADIIAATFFMLSRWEETVNPHRDAYDRFPATESVAYKQGFLDRPIIDEYALILREWIKLLLPNWEPEPRQFTVKLSHDIDHIRRFPSTMQGGRTLAGDLLKRKNGTQARQSLTDLWQQTVMPDRTPYMQNIYRLADLSQQYGFKSAFYFMAAEPGPYDSGYDPASPVIRRCVDELLEQGHEIGFHPSYRTFGNLEQLALEKARFDQALGLTGYGGRQHYLRFNAPETWRHWEQVGLAYDSTVGYADHEGFRCGTCLPFKPFDVQENRELTIFERPLIAMEGTLYHYRQLSQEESMGRILKLAERCRLSRGEFTLLWHNYTFGGEAWQPDSPLYGQIVSKLAGLGAAL